MNNPLNQLDPFGLKVTGTYDIKNHTLTLKDEDSGETITIDNMFSGNLKHANNPDSQHVVGQGPLPKGEYLIGHGKPKKDHPGDNLWFPLYCTLGEAASERRTSGA